MQHFPIDINTLCSIISEALHRGGDYADIFLEHSFSTHLTMQDGVVNRASSNIDYGAGIRVIEGERSGYAYCEELSTANLLQAARTAANIAAGHIVSSTPINIHPIKFTNHYPIVRSWQDENLDNIIPLLIRGEHLIKEKDSRIQQVQGMISYRTQHIGFINSLGEWYEETRPLGSVSFSCVIKDGDRIEQARASRSFRQGAEMLTAELIDTLSQECIDKARFALSAQRPQGGTMPVVMSAGASGILLHEAIGHAFEADFIRKNVSIFSDMLGKKICNSAINVIDDGTIMGNRGSVNVDDEGNLGQKTYLVKDGCLAGFLHDRISARHFGVPATGNGRRESFRSMPIPRMRATYMEGGDATEEELIHSVRKGIYVKDFSNGQVQIGAGDFTFFVKSGYLIEDGHLTRPLKDINIIGNGPQALADIVAVADNPKIDNSTWMCGKDGQSCPVTCRMPGVLVKQFVVGGE